MTDCFRRLNVERTDVDIVDAVSLSAVAHPGNAGFFDRDCAAHEILLLVRNGERSAPRAVAEILDQELIAEARREVVLEVLRLLLQLRRLDAPLFLLVRVRDPGQPERAVGTVAGRGEVV